MYIVSFDKIFIENAILLSKRLNIEFIQEMNAQPNDIIIVFGVSFLKNLGLCWL